MASAHGIPDGTVLCLWLVVPSDSCGMVLVCMCSVVSPHVLCVNCPDVTLASDFREFCMNSKYTYITCLRVPFLGGAGLV